MVIITESPIIARYPKRCVAWRKPPPCERLRRQGSHGGRGGKRGNISHEITMFNGEITIWPQESRYSFWHSVDAVYESRSSILLCLMVFGHKRNAMGQSKGWSADLICLSCHISSNRWFTLVMDIFHWLSSKQWYFLLGLNSSRVVTSALPAPGIRHLLLLPGGHQLRSPAHLRSSRRGTKKLLVYHGENHQKDRCYSLTSNLGFAVWKKFTYV